jgi:prevent-host-death family protein
MKRPALAEDLVPVADLRANMAGWIKKVDTTRRPVVVTHRGKAAAVLVHPAMLDDLEEERELIQKVLRGLRESEGPLVEDAAVWQQMEDMLEG